MTTPDHTQPIELIRVPPNRDDYGTLDGRWLVESSGHAGCGTKWFVVFTGDPRLFDDDPPPVCPVASLDEAKAVIADCTRIALRRAENRPTATGVPRNRYFCSGCGAWWSGLLTAHCTGCDRTFTGFTAFDEHRAGSHASGTRHCVDPASVGLVDAGRAYPCWGSARSDDDRWADE
jgi:hypothetical protein